MLTDGDDTDSLHTLHDVIAAAQRSEIQIYPLTIHSTRRSSTVAIGSCNVWPTAPAGVCTLLPPPRIWATAFAQIEQDLRTQYYVSFPPQQSTPGYHSLACRGARPGKLEVHARQGYYALAQ